MVKVTHLLTKNLLQNTTFTDACNIRNVLFAATGNTEWKCSNSPDGENYVVLIRHGRRGKMAYFPEFNKTTSTDTLVHMHE